MSPEEPIEHISLFAPAPAPPPVPQYLGVTVALIVKNCAESLEVCLSSLATFIQRERGDELLILDTGSTDDGATVACAKKHHAKVIEHPAFSDTGLLDLVKHYLPEHYDRLKEDPQYQGGMILDFAAARNSCYALAKNPILFWLDSDDELVGGRFLRERIHNKFKTGETSALFVAYDYAFDPDGTCITTLWRERVTTNSGWTWRGVCHESLVPREGVTPKRMEKVDPQFTKIIHRSERAHELSDIRNYVLLRNAHEKDSWKDPRHEFYLANAARGLGRWQEAVSWYRSLLTRSGSRDDRYTAALNIAYTLIGIGRPWAAMDWFWQAIKIWPVEPRSYFGISRAYHDLAQYENCLVFAEMARGFPPQEVLLSQDDNLVSFYPLLYEARSAQKLGRMQLAVQKAQQFLALRPNFEVAKLAYHEITSEIGKQERVAAVSQFTSLVFSPDAAIECMQRLRPELRKQIPELYIETSVHVPKGKRSLTIIAPSHPEITWDGLSLETGIGGSEKMCILYAREFAARGWLVNVYGNPSAGTAHRAIEGVTYRPLSAFNPLLPRDVILLWRCPYFIHTPLMAGTPLLKAQKIFVDMHDVADDRAFQADLSRASGVFWKSKFHRQTAPSCPEDKCIYSRNAILPEHFQREDVPRKPHQILWTSSADRGLQAALRAWEIISGTAPPDAEFHVYYGFTALYRKRAAQITYAPMGDFGCDRHMLDYQEECFSLMDTLPRVRYHAFADTKTLEEAQLSSSIWLYPTTFAEISCMSAMEAQAAGAFPVCSDSGALGETVTYGSIVPPNEPEKVAAAVLNFFEKGAELDDYRREMRADAQKRFSLKPLVDDWEQEFLK